VIAIVRSRGTIGRRIPSTTRGFRSVAKSASQPRGAATRTTNKTMNGMLAGMPANQGTVATYLVAKLAKTPMINPPA